MATFDWPTSLTPQALSWGLQKAGVSFRSPMAGSVESVEFPGQYWKASITLAPAQLRAGCAGEAFFARIAGGVERIRVPYWPRLVPLGTMRGTPTVRTAAVRGDLVLVLNTGANDTLRAGDMFGVAGQLFQVFQDCVAVAGVLTVPLVNRVRSPGIALAAAVTWSAPTFLGSVPASSSARGYEPGMAAPLAVDVEEVPA